MANEVMSARLERALRWASACHAGQTRKGSDLPYYQHVAAVALILARAGFEEDVVIAGVLHDIVEDTSATIEDVATRFGPTIALTVRACSEVKQDAEGRKRPWVDRKRDHLDAIRSADDDAKAVTLADKLHNLTSIAVDLEDGHPVWERFNADRNQVLAYHEAMIDACSTDNPRIAALASACREWLARVREWSGTRVLEVDR